MIKSTGCVLYVYDMLNLLAYNKTRSTQAKAKQTKKSDNSSLASKSLHPPPPPPREPVKHQEQGETEIISSTAYTRVYETVMWKELKGKGRLAGRTSPLPESRSIALRAATFHQHPRLSFFTQHAAHSPPQKNPKNNTQQTTAPRSSFCNGRNKCSCANSVFAD